MPRFPESKGRVWAVPVCVVTVALSIAGPTLGGCKRKSKAPASEEPLVDPTLVNEPNSPAQQEAVFDDGPIRLDLYGDPLPEDAVARLGSVRMLEAGIRQMAFSAKGDMLVSNSHGGFAVWDPDTSQREYNLEVPRASWAFALHPHNGDLAFATRNGAIEVWNTKTRSRVKGAKNAHTKEVSALCYLDATTLVSTSEDRTLAIWDVTSNEVTETKRLKGNWGAITALGCGSFGRLLVWGDMDGGVYWLDVSVAGWNKSLGSMTKRITDISVSGGGGKVAAASADGVISIWPRSDNGKPGRPTRISAHDNTVASVHFNGDGTAVLSSGGDRYLREWNAKTGNLERSIDLVPGLSAQYTALSPRGDTIVSWSKYTRARGTEKGRFWTWDRKTTAAKGEPDRHTNSIDAVVALENKTIVTGSVDGTIRTWSLLTGKQLKENRAHGGRVHALLADKAGAVYSGGEDSKIRVEKPRGKTKDILEPVGGELTALEKRNDTLYTGDRTGRVWTFSLSNGKRIRSEDHGLFAQINALAVSPSGDELAIAGSEKFIAVNASGGRLVAKLDRNVRANLDVAFSPDGTQLAAGTAEYTVELWNTKPYAPANSLTGHDGAVTAVAYSESGALLASGSNDGTIRLWQMPAGELLKTYEGHKGAVNDVTFAADDSYVVSVSDDHTGLVWDIRGAGAPKSP